MTGWELWQIRRELAAGRDALAGLDLASVDSSGGIAAVGEDADGHVQRADRLARRSVGLTLLSGLPLVGPQVGALRDLTDATAGVSDRTAAAARTLDAELEAGGSRPNRRVALLEQAVDELRGIRATVRGTDPGADGPLVLPPLSSARDELATELEEAENDLGEGIEITTALSDFLTGPRRYLVLAANNAEMRGGAGMPLSAGVADIDDGAIDVGDFVQTGDINLGEAGRVEAPEDLARLYDFLGLGKEFRNATVSPNFPKTAPLLARMSARTAFGPVDGVIMVDAIALRAMLAAVGPVKLDGRTYDANNVVEEVLNTNYLRFGAVAQRRDLQNRLALKVFDTLNERSFSVTKLAAGLVDAAKGRHVLAWSSAAGEQDLWERLEVAGELEPDALMVTVQNNSGSKLDWYIQPTVVAETQRRPGGTTRVSLAIAVPNPRRDPTGPFVESAFPFLPGGLHRVLVAVYLPVDAGDIAVDGAGIKRAGPDSPMQVVLLRYVIDYGDVRWVRVHFTLPPRFSSLTVLPGGRVQPTIIWHDGVATSDATASEITWSLDDTA